MQVSTHNEFLEEWNKPHLVNTASAASANKSVTVLAKPQELTFGPLNKSLFTQEFELVVKTILKHPKLPSLKYEDNNLHFKLDDIEINVSALLKKVNFSHLAFNAEDSTQYFNTVNPYGHANAYNDLTSAEASAIKDYTGSGYYGMNNLLHGKYVSYTWSEDLGAILLKTAFLGSGLNKLPAAHMENVKSYRGDSPTLEAIDERIEFIEKGEGLTDTPAFFSTSADIDVAKNFAKKAIIHFDATYGKDISEISKYPSEKEFLLEPCTLMWTQHEIQNGKHVFHAQKVVPLIEGKDTPSHQDLETFSKLSQWAGDHRVETGFITPHLKTMQEDYLAAIRPQSEKQGSNIGLHDCIKMSDDIVGLDLNNNNGSLSPMIIDVVPDNSAFNMTSIMNELNLVAESTLNGALMG